MKLPRGVSGDRLIRTLQQVGYSIVRQSGSHFRLQHPDHRFTQCHCSAAQSAEEWHASRNPGRSRYRFGFDLEEEVQYVGLSETALADTIVSSKLNLQSHVITQGHDRAPARAMVKAIGFTDEDLRKPIIGVANTWIETMPATSIRRLTRRAPMNGCTGHERRNYTVAAFTSLG